MASIVLTADRVRAPRVHSTSAVGLAWLVRLRWAFAAAQLVVGLGAELLDQPWSLPVVGASAAVTVLTNAVLFRWVSRDASGSAPPSLMPFLVLDGVLLTVTLLASGGASNPFSVLYIVHVALAALLLDRRATLLVAGTTMLGFALLFVAPSLRSNAADHAGHTHAGHAAHAGPGFEAHLRGMLAAYALTAIFVGYFVHRVARELARREREAAELRDWAARTERLASLSALATGAAHELGSPLGTIAVAAKELERAAAAPAPLDVSQILADARLVRAEAERCRLIIGKMGTGAGDVQGGAPKRVAVADVLAKVTSSLGDARGSTLGLGTPPAGAFVVATEDALVQAIVTLAVNAFDAIRESGGAVTLDVSVEEGRVVFRVGDDGPGISPDVVRRLGEPFFSTKDGQGMGLGLFLTRSFAERVGGELAVDSEPGRGATFTLAVPGGVA